MLTVDSILLRASSLSITKAQQGELDHPFCGALIRMSTPHFFISTHMEPEAIQSSTIMPSVSCELASAIAFKVAVPEASFQPLFRRGLQKPALASPFQWTATNLFHPAAERTAKPAPPSLIGAAFITKVLDGIFPVSKNLCPAIAEPSVSDDQAFPAGGELPGDRLHAEGSASGNNLRCCRR